jgi:hypothetical protein
MALGRRTCSGLVGYGVGLMALKTGSCLVSRIIREEMFARDRGLSRNGVRTDPSRVGGFFDFDFGEDIAEDHRIVARLPRKRSRGFREDAPEKGAW